MLGVTFKGLDGAELPLNEIVSGEFLDGDEIQVYTPGSGSTFYSYWKDYGGWLDGAFNTATTPCKIGTGFWLKTPDRSVTVTLKGAVPMETFRYESQAGFQMLSLGTPRELDLNRDITWTGLTDGDEIQVRKDGQYVFYSYWKDYGGWLTGSFEVVSEPIAIGSSIWLKTANSGATATIQGLN